jgi:hypothetical protein
MDTRLTLLTALTMASMQYIDSHAMLACACTTSTLHATSRVDGDVFIGGHVCRSTSVPPSLPVSSSRIGVAVHARVTTSTISRRTIVAESRVERRHVERRAETRLHALASSRQLVDVRSIGVVSLVVTREIALIVTGRTTARAARRARHAAAARAPPTSQCGRRRACRDLDTLGVGFIEEMVLQHTTLHLITFAHAFRT